VANGRLGLDGPGAQARAHRDLLVFLRRLAQLGVLILALLAGGTIAFVLTEHVTIWFAFVWTVDTIATVGAIASPDTVAGQVVKVLLIVLGVGTLLYALVAITEFFVAGHVSGLLREHRRQRVTNALSDHYLICGFGRVGQQVARDLRAAGAALVVIDTNPASLEVAEDAGIPYVEGEASDDSILREAGIERAHALLACVDSDADNIFITLTARELRPDLTIVARAGRDESEAKLRRAGADRVISPYKSSGSDMARLALHPQVSDLVDVAPEYRLEEIEVSASCEGIGRALADISGSAVVAAVRRADGELIPQPPGELVLREGDTLIASGTAAAMDRLDALFAPRDSAAARR
jgi:voltage-gated potassium channel